MLGVLKGSRARGGRGGGAGMSGLAMEGEGWVVCCKKAGTGAAGVVVGREKVMRKSAKGVSGGCYCSCGCG